MTLLSRILRPLCWAVLLMLAAALAEAPLRLALHGAKLATMPAPAGVV